MEREYPYLNFMISKNPDPIEQIPVMGFIGKDYIIEIFIDDIIKSLNPKENHNLGYTRVANISETNDRELIIGFSRRDAVLRYKVGKKGVKTKSDNDIEYKGELAVSNVMAAIVDFENQANDWMNRIGD